MSEDVDLDDGDLRRKARAALLARKLPDRLPDRTWGGAGTGGQCAICDRTVTAPDLEMELEFRAAAVAERYSTHLRCFMAWERERRTPLTGACPAAPGSGAPGATAGGSLPRGGDIAKI